MVSRLPASLRCTIDGNVVPRPDGVDTLAAFRKTLENSAGCMEFSVAFGTDAVELTTDAFVAIATDTMRHLVPIWQFAAWSKTNDKLKLKPVLKEEKKTLAKRTAGFEEGDECWSPVASCPAKKAKSWPWTAKAASACK